MHPDLSSLPLRLTAIKLGVVIHRCVGTFLVGQPDTSTQDGQSFQIIEPPMYADIV